MTYTIMSCHTRNVTLYGIRTCNHDVFIAFMGSWVFVCVNREIYFDSTFKCLHLTNYDELMMMQVPLLLVYLKRFRSERFFDHGGSKRLCIHEFGERTNTHKEDVSYHTLSLFVMYGENPLS